MSGGKYMRDPFSKKTVRFSMILLISILLIGLLAPVLSNEKPFYVKYKGANLFPALSWKGHTTIKNTVTQEEEKIVYSTIDWKSVEKESVIWCPIPYSPGRSDWSNAGFRSPLEKQVDFSGKSELPLRFRHWLGTTKTGADVLSGIIHGTRISLTVGIFSMALSGLIGILLGLTAGYFGDQKFRVSKVGVGIAILIGIPVSYFYCLYMNIGNLSTLLSSSILFFTIVLILLLLLMVVIIYIFYLAGKFLGGIFNFRSTMFLRIDGIISRCIEVFNSIPRIVLIITLSAVARPSLINLILIIGLTSWTEIARLVRAEMLFVRESEFMQSAEASGISMFRQIFRHALPNVLAPATTAILLGIASAILTESALSFLGIGVPVDIVTWGSLLNESRQNFNAWWLVIFPGLAIFTTLSTLTILGDALREKLIRRKN